MLLIYGLFKSEATMIQSSDQEWYDESLYSSAIKAGIFCTMYVNGARDSIIICKIYPDDL